MASQPPYGYDPQGQPQGSSPTNPSQPQYPYPGQPSVPLQPQYVAPVAYAPVMHAAPADPGAGLAIAGMVLGIVGLALFWVPACFLGLPSAIVGVVLSGIGMRSKTRHGMAIAGLACAVVAILLIGYEYFATASFLSHL